MNILKENNFKNLLNNNEFKEYLSLFEKDYIEDYFKEEILEIKENNETINTIIEESILSEKEKIKIISI